MAILVILGSRDKNYRALQKMLGLKEKYKKVAFKRVLEIAWSSGCKEVVVERNYVDSDYLEEYSRFYSKCFKSYSRAATRIHFFAGNILKKLGLDKGLKNWGRLGGLHTDKLQENYIGFTVVRPLDNCLVGRTILSPHLKSENGDYVLPKCHVPVNLNGIKLYADGMPFIQQDTQAGACASSDLWMIARYKHHQFRQQKRTLPEITEIANKYLRHSRPFPASEGLTFNQMVFALSEMGRAPMVISKEKLQKKNIRIENVIYTYLESKLPVILTVKKKSGAKHVLLAIGHDFDRKRAMAVPDVPTKSRIREWKAATSGENWKSSDNFRNIKMYRNADFINNYIIHDDASGPYLHMPLKPVPANGVYISEKADGEVYRKVCDCTMDDVLGIIVPAPIKLHLTGEDAESEAVTLLYSNEETNAKIYDDCCSEDFLGNYKSGRLYMRTYYMQSNEFKSNLYKTGLDTDLAYAYEIMDLPRLLWIVELTTPKMIKEGDANGHKIYGEVIIDPTGSKTEKPNFLSVHTPGIAFLRMPNDSKDIAELKLDKDVPYRSHARMDGYGIITTSAGP